MIAISSVKELNKILKQHLVVQSELDSKNVVNSLSTYGKTLEKKLEQQIVDSYDRDDSVMLFELRTRPSSSNISLTEIDNTITMYRSYELRLIIYGNSSADVANKVVARFRTQNVRETLLGEGVYLEEVRDPDSFNEFVNDVMWLRNDVSILLSCQFEISQITTDSEFEVISDLQIIKEGE